MKILVCDDEPLARERLSRMVQDAGHTVVAQATNGIEALEAVRIFQPEYCSSMFGCPKWMGCVALRR